MAIVVLVLTMLYGYWDLPQDDSYIFYTYARNIAEGNGYVFNPGERVNATTSPLYTLLLATVYRIVGSESPDALPLIGRIIGALSLLLLAQFLGDCFRDLTDSLLPRVVPLTFLMNPLLTNAFGMELFTAMMFAVASVAMYLRSRLKTAALLSALAVLARPDMLIVAGLVLLHFVYRHRKLPSALAIALFALPVGVWLGFSWFYFGNLLPSTYAAKLVQSEAGLWGGRWTFITDLFSPFSWYGGVVTADLAKPVIILITLYCAGLIVGVTLLFIKHRTLSAVRHPAVPLLAGWSLLHFVAYAFVLQAPAYTWYYTPLAIGITVIVALPLDRLVRSCSGATETSRRIVVITSVGMLTALGLWLPLASRGHRAVGEFTPHREAASWLNVEASQGASVGSFDIDILGYFYRKGPVIDGLGLVTPTVVEHVRDHEFTWFVREYEPDYLMLAHPPRGEIEGMATEPWFSEQYVLRTVVSADHLAVAIYQKNR